jgi:hypothetical protein
MPTLNDVSSIIRSKNSGPFELTFDVIFNDTETYIKIRDSGFLTEERFCQLYSIERDKLVTFVWFDAANAFKATIIRPRDSGSFGERDTYGAQQAAPLSLLEIPL